MNGDNRELYHAFKEDFIELKTRMEERWDNHDKRAEERGVWIRKSMEKLNNLPCEVHKGFFANAKIQIGALWVLVVGVILKMIFWK